MIDAPHPTNRTPQPTNRKLRRTALSPEPPGPPGTPVSTATTAEQAPLSKGAGRGASRGLGDCLATVATPEQANYPAATPVGAHIVRPGTPTGMPLLSNGSLP